MRATIYIGDVMERLRELPEESVQCVVTSPPYWGLRDYGTAIWSGGDPECDHRNLHGVQGKSGDRADRTFTGSQNYYLDTCKKCGARRIDAQLGLEKTPEEYIGRMVEVFREVRRVLRGDGTLWLNMGDSYAAGGKGGGGSYMAERRDAAWQKQSQVNGWRSHPIGMKDKDLCGIPWMLAFALRADGWWLRQDIIWSKPNPMPESVTDRCTKAHEYLFLLSKSARYYYDAEAVMEDCASGPSDVKKMLESKERIGGKHKDLIDPLSKASSTTNIGQKRSVGGKLAVADEDENRAAKTASFGRGAGWRDDPCTARLLRNKRSVWEIATQPFSEAHFATFPEKLVEPCILAGSKEGDAVLDPFCGSGITGVVALRYHRDFLGIELNPEYAEMAERRIGGEIPLFAGVEVVRPKLAAVAGD